MRNFETPADYRIYKTNRSIPKLKVAEFGDFAIVLSGSSFEGTKNMRILKKIEIYLYQGMYYALCDIEVQRSVNSEYREYNRWFRFSLYDLEDLFNIDISYMLSGIIDSNELYREISDFFKSDSSEFLNELYPC